MKIHRFLGIALPIAGISFLLGCHKGSLPYSGNPTEPHQHFLSAEFDGWCNVVHDIDGGWISPNPAPAWHSAKGAGHLNLLGQARDFINMYVSVCPEGLQVTPASVNVFFTEELKELGIAPPDEVAIMFYDGQGNSIWAGRMGTVPVKLLSTARATFDGEIEIVGGTGKFALATGQIHVFGFFNPQHAEETGLQVSGVIVY